MKGLSTDFVDNPFDDDNLSSNQTIENSFSYDLHLRFTHKQFLFCFHEIEFSR